MINANLEVSITLVPLTQKFVPLALVLFLWLAELLQKINSFANKRL